MPDRILIIVPGFPASEDDTTCLPAVHNFVRMLARRRTDIRVVALHYPFTQGSYDWHGIAVYSAGGSNAGGIRKLQTWGRAWRAIHNLPVDLVHSFWVGECALLGALSARQLRRPHVASIGGSELRAPTVYSRLLRGFDFSLVAGSDAAATTALRTLGRTPDAIIPLGLDVEHFRPDGQARTIDVLFVGSLIAGKRPGDVIAVAQGLPARRFVIVGDGPERSDLERSAPRNVEFTGRIDRPEVIALMQRSKILLHPSEFESQGYVFLEALASGMHVVCREVGAPGNSRNVHRRSTTDEVRQTVDALLRRTVSFPAVPVPTAEESVQSYIDVYRSAFDNASYSPKRRSSFGGTSHRS